MPDDASRSGPPRPLRAGERLLSPHRATGPRVARALLGVAALAGLLALAPRRALAQQEAAKPSSPPNLDDVEYGQLIDPSAAIDADKMLKVWSTRLATLIVVDPQIASVKIKFLTSDVKLTWGLFKKVLDFYDVVLDEKQVGRHWLMLAHLRAHLAGKETPPFPVIAAGEPLPKREQVVTALVQVLHGAASEIANTVRGLLVRDQNRVGNILCVRGPEVIILVDFAANVDYYTKIIRALDVPAPGQLTRVVNVEFAPAEDVARVLQSFLRTASGGGLASGPGAPVVIAPGGNLAAPQVIADPRTNKLIIQAYAYEFDEIDHMIKELDVKAPPKAARFYFYKCKYVAAGYLAEKLSELFTGQKSASLQHHGGGSAGSKVAGGSGANPGGGAVSLAPQNGSQKSDFSAIETRVVPDELQNALLIQAEKPVYEQILALLEGSPELGPGLDHPRRRVLVEAQVLEVSTPADNMTIGFELAGIQNPKQGAFRPSGLTDFGLSSVSFDQATGVPTRVPNITQGLTAVLTKDTFSKIPILMQAIASLEKSRVVTTPFALTNDNETAHFDVTLTTSYMTNTLAPTGLAQSSFTPLQIPSSIDVTPEVNSEDNVTLEVDVSIATATGGGGSGAPPNVNARHLKVTVTVPNMRYVIFGGLESEAFDESETKVPWLGDIPYLGQLFKTKTWSHNNSKIYIFIRPTIFTDDASLVRPSDELRRRAHVAAEREDWIPPIVSERLVREPWKTVQDGVFDVFGTGSGNPFAAQPAGE